MVDSNSSKKTLALSLDDCLAEIRNRSKSERDKGVAFERLARKAMMTHPGEFGSLRFERIIPWTEWEGADGQPDTGIDLVGYQRDGGLAAIQCKFYGAGSKVKKEHIDGFIARSNTKHFTARILINTGDAFTPAAAKLMSEVTPHVELILLEDMRLWPVADWAGCLDEEGSLVWDHKAYTPYSHQQEAIDRVLEGFEKTNRGKMIMPCGTGKSVTAMWIAEQLAGLGGSVLYLVPSIALMGQSMREWARNRGMSHRYVGVCSDSRAGKIAEDQSLAELTMPVTTDVQRITEQLIPDKGSLSVVFCTYQSLPQIVEAQKLLGEGQFDLVVCDEAHRTTGVDKNTDSGFLLVHDAAQLRASKRLYMTATPKVYTDRVKEQASSQDFGVYTMDDEEQYGPEFYRLSFGEAIEQDLLSDYQVIAIAVDNAVTFQRDKTAFGNTGLDVNDAIQFAGVLDALADPETEGIDRLVKRATGTINIHCRAKRAIAFNNTIKQSQQVAEYLPRVADRLFSQADPQFREDNLIDLEVRHIDGKSDALTRSQSIQWLREGVTSDTGCLMLTNARCLTEGVDVPALDAVVFCSPRKSQIDVVQAVGRVMRKAEGKDVGYVIVPVQVQPGQSAVDALDTSAFNEVWSVLRALRSHDERLDVIVNSADLGGTSKLPVKVLDVTSKARKQSEDGVVDGDLHTPIQSILFELHNKVASILVDKVGDKQYWKKWGRRTAQIAGSVESEIRNLRGKNGLKSVWQSFAADIRSQIGVSSAGAEASPTDAELEQMLAQHAITQPVFEALFTDSQFTQKNPMCLALTGVLEHFETHGLNVAEHCVPLEGFYKSFSERLEGADTSEARLGVLLEVYESFFDAAMPDVADKLGIVYTPVELVDFVLRSADAVARHEFGKGLTDEGVHILDPFTGTGTFINRLITGTRSTGEPLIEDKDLFRKFVGSGDDTPPELHANELVLLAYYLAAIKTEEGYTSRFPNTGYQAFQGLVWCDTFLNRQNVGNQQSMKGMRRNSRRAERQNDQDITVIVGNPPWSAGQKSSGDDNPNNQYPDIAERVRETYGKRHKEVAGKSSGGKSAGNLYVQAIRWASDRLPENKPGLISFIHPSSLTTGVSLAGVRACLRDEFTDIYVVNLRGDAMKSGEERRREGDNVFSGGSRSGVQITLLVRNMDKPLTEPAVLRYAEVPEYSSLETKFEWLRGLGDVLSDKFETVPVDDAHDWVNLTDGSFKELLPVCSTDQTDVRVACCRNASGVKTNCDAYVYSFSKTVLATKMRALIDEYSDTLEIWEAEGCDPADLKLLTANNNLGVIKWTDTLKASLRKKEVIEFDETRIREVLYRPFTKLWLYEDHRILSSVKTVAAMFPRAERSRAQQSAGSSLSQLKTTETPSASWQSVHSQTSISSDQTKVEQEQSPDGSNTDDKPVKSDSVRGAGNSDPARSAHSVPSMQSDTTNLTEAGGGMSSQRQTDGRCSQFSQPQQSPTYALQGPVSQHDTFLAGNSDIRDSEYDVSSVSNEHADRFSDDRGIAADKGDTANRSLTTHTHTHTHTTGNPHQPHPTTPLRDHRQQHALRPVRYRKANQMHPTTQAIAITGPPTTGEMGILSVTQIVDLHLMGTLPPCRIILKQKRS